jgi:hypothetical protein|tara:strand:+ start:248 stop:997 length:750 start_codon:yes stop_codon:yes gene_type:complete
LTVLDEYSNWVSQNPPDVNLPNWRTKGKFFKENRSEYAASVECLKSSPADTHDGYPPDSYGYDLNEPTLRKTLEVEGHRFTSDEKEWIKKYIEKSQDLDDTLGAYIGYKFCALKMYYPKDGYIAWHTNWNVPGFNCLFTWNPTGEGYWRHLDSSGEKPGSIRANPDIKLVHIDDVPGWHCKLGYYGKKEEHNKIMWHAAYGGPRITLGWVVFDENIWEDIIEELTSEEKAKGESATYLGVHSRPGHSQR